MGKQALTVIGLGPMGQAMVGAFLDAGHPVTIWNRTTARADALVTRGAVRAATVAEAVATNDLIILSLTDYDAMYAVLAPIDDALGGRVVVNLSSDTPARAREAAAWMAERGAGYLAGGVQVPPSMIGRPGASTYYSGPAELFEAHRDTLSVLSGADYRGEDPGLAALHYQILMDMFWTTMTGFLHAVALADAHGIPAPDILPVGKAVMAMMPTFFEASANAVAAGAHPGGAARLRMSAASVEHVLASSREAGVDATLPAAVSGIFQRGLAAGHGEESFSSLIDVLRTP